MKPILPGERRDIDLSGHDIEEICRAIRFGIHHALLGFHESSEAVQRSMLAYAEEMIEIEERLHAHLPQEIGPWSTRLGPDCDCPKSSGPPPYARRSRITCALCCPSYVVGTRLPAHRPAR